MTLEEAHFPLGLTGDNFLVITVQDCKYLSFSLLSVGYISHRKRLNLQLEISLKRRFTGPELSSVAILQCKLTSDTTWKSHSFQGIVMNTSERVPWETGHFELREK